MTFKTRRLSHYVICEDMTSHKSCFQGCAQYSKEHFSFSFILETCHGRMPFDLTLTNNFLEYETFIGDVLKKLTNCGRQ